MSVGATERFAELAGYAVHGLNYLFSLEWMAM